MFEHATNYHRMIVHDLAWAIRLGEVNGHLLSKELRDLFAAAIRFLFALVDPESGCVPNYGARPTTARLYFH